MREEIEKVHNPTPRPSAVSFIAMTPQDANLFLILSGFGISKLHRVLKWSVDPLSGPTDIDHCSRSCSYPTSPKTRSARESYKLKMCQTISGTISGLQTKK